MQTTAALRRLSIAVFLAGTLLSPTPAMAAKATAWTHLAIHHPFRKGPLVARPAVPAATSPVGYIPCDLANAYRLAGPGLTGANRTIAIIDSFAQPTIATDLQTFDAAFTPSLPDPPNFSTATPSAMVPQPFGPPSTGNDPSSAPETTLDVEWAHAMAPNANIVLIQALNENFDLPAVSGDVTSAIQYAVNTVDADVVSMSFGIPEAAFLPVNGGGGFAEENAFNQLFPPLNGAGNPITYVAATGDFGFDNNGFGPSWPAIAPGVVGVGGTSLAPGAFGYSLAPGSHLDCSGASLTPGVTPSSETVWGDTTCGGQVCGTGGGSSLFEHLPAWQSMAPNGARGNPDVAMDADPNVSGVATFEAGAWNPFAAGGTSLAAPLWAGVTAMLDQGRAAHGLPALNMSAVSAWPYASPGTDFNDITMGSAPATLNPIDPCIGSGACDAQPGYDLVTGRGSPMFPAIAADLGGVGTISTRGNLTTVTPTRVMDTRVGIGGVPQAPMLPNEVLELDLPQAAGASAIVVNVGVTDAAGMSSGYVLVYPCGPRPFASTLNFLQFQTTAILTQVAVTPSTVNGTPVGCLDVYLNTAGATGHADVFLDLQGTYSPTPSGASGLYNPLPTPIRALDTRLATGGHQAPFGPGESFPLTVAGSFGIPADATAVTLNLTAVLGDRDSYLSTYPSIGGGTPCPAATTFSNLNFPAGRVQANRVTVKIGVGGQICFYNSEGSVNVLADLAGWFSGLNDTTGLLFSPWSPVRIYDSRLDRPLSGGTDTCPGANFVLPVVPAVGAVSMNLTGLDATVSTYLESFPTGSPPNPPTSDLNFVPGLVQPNLVVTRVGSGPSVTICNSAGATDFFVDMNGVYSG